jgi:hypothetical protein
MFLILLLAWLLKISSPKLKPDGGQAEFAYSLAEWIRDASIGPVPVRLGPADVQDASGVENVGSSPSSRTAGFDFLPMEKTARVGVGLTQDLVG